MDCVKFTTKCGYSLKNNDSSMVYISSTDDEEVHSVLSEEEDKRRFISGNTKATNSLLKRVNHKKFNEIKIDRILGPPCGCKRRCREKLKNNHEIIIFSRFWNLASKDQQTAYLFSCIEVRQKKRTYISRNRDTESRRSVTAFYSVDNGDGIYVDVCKEEFANLHGLQNSKGRLDHIVKMKRGGALVPKRDGRGKHANRPNRLKINQSNCKNS